MDIGILGPLTVARDGIVVPLGGSKQRSILGYLLVHAGRVVTPAALAATIWGERPPADVPGTVQTYVFHLRQALEPTREPRQTSRFLRTVPTGYVFDVADIDLDRSAFETALAAGRARLDGGDAAAAAAELLRGLALWRGRPLADLPDFPFVVQEAARLEKLRLDAVELRMQAEILLDHDDQVLSELEHLVTEHPERERLTAALMTALYRSGRQADALLAYQRTRTALVKQLGVEPGRPLRQLHDRLLRQDPLLDAQPAQVLPTAPTRISPAEPTPPATRLQEETTPPVPTPAAPRGQGERRRPRGLLLLGALLALGLAGAAVTRAIGTADHPDIAPAPTPTPTSNRIFNDYELMLRPGIAYDVDIPPGRPPDWHAGNDAGSADYQYTDLYRPMRGPDQISGVDVNNTGAYNVVQLVDARADASACRRLLTSGGGRVRLEGLRPGARLCLRTHDGRWALITLLELPPSREAPVLIRVLILAG